MLGNLTISQVLDVPVPPYQLEMMRKSGQVDCGRRQRLVPCVDESGEPLQFPDLPDSLQEAEAALARILQAERAAGRPAERIELDRTIPCL